MICVFGTPHRCKFKLEQSERHQVQGSSKVMTPSSLSIIFKYKLAQIWLCRPQFTCSHEDVIRQYLSSLHGGTIRNVVQGQRRLGPASERSRTTRFGLP